MMAGRKRLLMPSIVSHPSRDTIKQYVNGRSVILRRTRDGGVCGFQEERSLRRLWRLGGRVQNRRWAEPETVGYALDSQGSE